MDGRMDGRMDRWIDVRNGWKDGWKDEWMDGWMEEDNHDKLNEDIIWQSRKPDAISRSR